MDGERTYMKFEKVVIKNFRNFDNVELDLSNKNIFFGLNDVGKTNFLWYAYFLPIFADLCFHPLSNIMKLKKWRCAYEREI